MPQGLRPYDVLRVAPQRACHHERARRRRAAHQALAVRLVTLAARLVTLAVRLALLIADLCLAPCDEGGGGARVRDPGCGERGVAAEDPVAVVLRLAHLVRVSGQGQSQAQAQAQG